MLTDGRTETGTDRQTFALLELLLQLKMALELKLSPIRKMALELKLSPSRK